MPEAFAIQLSDLRPGTQFRQYRLLEQIGVGGQGVVWSAHDQTADRIVAIKFNEIPNSDQKKAEDQIFDRQIRSLATLRHRYILPMYDFGLSAQIRYLVTPYIPGESLEDRLNAGMLSSDKGLYFAAQIVSALDYLHAQQVVHRDLKPANILMDFSQNLYVADFGLARILSLSTQSMHTGRGTPPYASPEQHSMAEISPQSDLYSFGVMLYEMFTGQLPWNGEKILGIQQLHSYTEIPDPAKIDPALPADLVILLRRLTAADPAMRPASARDAMTGIYTIFQTQPILLDEQNPADETPRQEEIAEKILQNGLKHWGPRQDTTVLSLTKFAYVELKEKKTAGQNTSPAARRFMLHSALAFGYDDDFWWAQITDPKERLSIARQLIGHSNSIVAARIVRHILRDSQIRTLKFSLPEGGMESLLEMALNADDLSLREQVIQFLQIYTPSPQKWRPLAFTKEQDRALASLALEDSPLGDEAARLIGHLRSEQAVRTALKTANEARRMEILLLIQKTAHSLPGLVPLQIRFGTMAEAISRRLTARPLALLSAYALIFAGAALSVGIQVYLTYRLPDFLDLERAAVSIERGIFLGALLAFGVLSVKLIVEGFPEINAFLRTAIASITGGLILSVSFFIYDILFLQTIPGGLVMPVGCLLLACAYALSGWLRPRILKILISYIACLTALAITWFTHISLASMPAALSPIFFYEYNWSAAQVLQTMLVVTLPLAIFTGLADLSPKDE